MGDGGGGGNTQTIVERNPEPWSGIQPYLSQLFSLGQQALQSGAGFPYTGPTLAPLSPYTQQSIAAQTQVAGGPMSQLASALGGANAFALSPTDVMGLNRMPGVVEQYGIRPGQIRNRMLDAAETLALGMDNPYFEQSIRAATRPVIESGRQLFQQQADAAQGAGAYGGTRDVMVAGDLGRKIAREVGDISSQMSSQNYQNVFGQAMANQLAQASALNQNQQFNLGLVSGAEQNAMNQALDALGRGLALGPQTMQGLLAPAQVYGNIGALRDARGQQNLNALINQYAQVQDFPWTQLGRFGSVLGMGPSLGGGGTETSTVSGGDGGNSLGSALGGALMGGVGGYGLATSLPVMTSLGSAIGPWGAAIGGALGLLSGLL
jgi:hypothetical protein